MADVKVITPIEVFDNENKAYGLFTHKRVHSCVGSPEKIEYAPELQKDGSIKLHEVGRTNIQERINSYRDSVDINAILTRFKNGDLKALERRQALYFDATDMPKTYTEMLDRAMKAEQYFNTLSNDERSKYANDWTQWLMHFDESYDDAPDIKRDAAVLAAAADLPGDRKDLQVMKPVEISESEVSA